MCKAMEDMRNETARRNLFGNSKKFAYNWKIDL